jgi:hypothetical protein
MLPEVKNASCPDGKSKIPIYSKIASKFNTSTSSKQINAASSGSKINPKHSVKNAPHEPIEKVNQSNTNATKSKLYK